MFEMILVLVTLSGAW